MPKPTETGESLGRGYKVWKTTHQVREDGKATNSGDYMIYLYPDRYNEKNRDSGRRTFNKITTGESSGRNLSLYNIKEYEPPKYLRKTTYTGQPIAKAKRYGAARITGEEAIYRVQVYYYYDQESFDQAVETNGRINMFGDTRSFNAYTNKHYTRAERPFVMLELQQAAESKILMWQIESPPKEGWSATRIEVTPIPADVSGKAINLDDMVMEDYDMDEDYGE
jgi:hypothetical protein